MKLVLGICINIIGGLIGWLLDLQTSITLPAMFFLGNITGLISMAILLKNNKEK